MSSGGVPELSLTAERSAELTQINRAILSRCKHLWDYIIELERLGGVTQREKLAMMAGIAYTTARAVEIPRARPLKHTIIRGLS